MVLDPTLTIKVICRNPLGIVALSLSRIDTEPFLLVGVYLPPATSTCSARRESILDFLSALWVHYRPLHPSGGTIGGDWNAQAGSLGGRLAELTKNLNDALCGPFRRRHELSYIHGRTTRAAHTSRKVGNARGTVNNGKGEPDGFVTDISSTATPMPDMPFSVNPYVSHRPIGAVFPLVRCDARPEMALPPPRKVSPRPPAANAPFWAANFATMAANMKRLMRRQQHVPMSKASMENTYEEFKRAYTYGKTNPVARKCPPSFVMRTYRGRVLPPEAALYLESVRKIRKRISKSKDKGEIQKLQKLMLRRMKCADKIARATELEDRRAHISMLRRARKEGHGGIMKALRECSRKTQSTEHRPTEAMADFIAHYGNLYTRPDTDPDGPHTRMWSQFIPHLSPDAPQQWQPYHWTEVYMIIMPFSQDVFGEFMHRGGRTPQCGASCTLCSSYVEQGIDHTHDKSTAKPKWTPTLSTGKTPGLDGITAEMFRHFRGPTVEDTLEYRIDLCKQLATMFDAMLEHGPPGTMADVIVSALEKMGKDGTHPDPADPNATRGISLHSTLMKLHDALIDVRFMHVIVTDKVVNALQMGFMPGGSCDQLIFLLKEMIRARMRQGLDTWVLLVDFLKAYDNVSPTAMWAVLTKIGFPPAIISYLRTCHETRSTHFSYNGSIVDVWEQLIGLCQGGVLSCLLFNLFIESLARYLDSREDLRGVSLQTPGGFIKLLQQYFADDMACIACSEDDTTLIGSAILEWCCNHGLTMSVLGTSKTAIMCIRAVPADGLAPAPVTLTYGTVVLHVPYTKEYKYLGVNLTDDMCTLREQEYVMKLFREALSIFMGNPVLNGCDIALQREYFLGGVIGKIVNLLAVTPCSIPKRERIAAKRAFNIFAGMNVKAPLFDMERELDNAMLDGVACILHTGTSYLGLTGLADMRLLPATALLIRTYERFRLHALSQDGPTGVMLRALLQDGDPASPAERQRTPRHMWSWAANYFDLIQRLGYPHEWRITPIAKIPRWKIHSMAAIAARRVAYALVAKQATEYRAKRTREEARDPTKTDRAPPPFLFRALIHDLAEPIQDVALPQPGQFRPSLFGGGVGLPTLSMAERHVRPLAHVLLHRALLGRMGLFQAPFLPYKQARIAGKKRRRTIAEKELLRAQYSQRQKSIFGRTNCHLCQGDTGDFIHFCTICTHPAMIRRREAALGEGRWAAHISAIATELYRAHSRKAPPLWLMEAIENMNIESCEARFITAWHITGYAWPASKAEPEWRVALALGKLFDRDVTLSEYRPVATSWVTSQHAVLSTVCLGWWKFISLGERAQMIANGHVLPPQPQRRN